MQSKDIVNRFANARNSLTTQQSDFTLAALYEMVKNNSINIRPDYQRRDRWDYEKQSALIESFLLNVPVPPIYFSEDEFGSYSVIDGNQRITAIYEFLSGKLELKGLKKFPELNGFKFNQMPPQLQYALFDKTYIRVTILLRDSDSQLKHEVFLRLNSGGDKLKAQEVRNAAYSGPLNELLFELAGTASLKEKLKITNDKSSAYRSMDDAEHVLRYLTLEKNWKTITRPLGEEMDIFMSTHRHDNVRNYRDSFLRALDGCVNIWGNHAFQKPTHEGWRDQLLSPLYDAQMIAVSMMDEPSLEHLQQRRDIIIDMTREIFESNATFVKAISNATHTPQAIRTRITLMQDLLQHALRY
ncbi:DUF262 domain-containing protein [Pseudomonas nunensis]|uniref:DUF262 domain-containing protein n=1 Tax=Pseudomonas nunensis TaxID=2961896 RepID=UPI0006B688BE|nr:DUF262 domain-containing protein [Pseudomonas nunensis]KOY00579.1 hypothetical protein AM274_20160 [Pseudomonas nunensis]